MWYHRPWVKILAVIVLALAIGAAINGSANHTAKESAKAAALVNYKSQLAACSRGNDLRQESNDRIAAHQVDKQNLIEFLEAAIEARKASGTKADLVAVKKYESYIHRERSSVIFDKFSLVNCLIVVKKP